jgi:hypothetical protein
MDRLVEYWLQDVSKEMRKKHTVGAFTKWCQEHGFRKASYKCIETAIKMADEILNNPKASEKERKEAILLKKRAVLARTFKKIAAKRKK